MPRSVHSHRSPRAIAAQRQATASPPESEGERKEEKSRAAVAVSVPRLLAEIYGMMSLCGWLRQRALWGVESSEAAWTVVLAVGLFLWLRGSDRRQGRSD